MCVSVIVMVQYEGAEVRLKADGGSATASFAPSPRAPLRAHTPTRQHALTLTSTHGYTHTSTHISMPVRAHTGANGESMTPPRPRAPLSQPSVRRLTMMPMHGMRAVDIPIIGSPGLPLETHTPVDHTDESEDDSTDSEAEAAQGEGGAPRASPLAKGFTDREYRQYLTSVNKTTLQRGEQEERLVHTRWRHAHTSPVCSG
jgi:hypothetical protein